MNGCLQVVGNQPLSLGVKGDESDFRTFTEDLEIGNCFTILNGGRSEAGKFGSSEAMKEISCKDCPVS